MRTYNSHFTDVDYEHLPETLQRKYFSSLERLRLAHDGTTSNLAPRPYTARKDSKASCHRSLSITSRLDLSGPTRQSSHRTRRRLQKTDRNSRRPSTAITSPSEYASLPPTLQKKLFTEEEQIILGSRVQEIILDAADEALCRRFRQQPTPDYDWSSNEINDEYFPYDLPEDQEPEFPEDKMNSSDLDSFRWLDDEDDLDLSLDDYHTVIAENAARLKAAPWTQSSRRGLSLSNVSFRRRSSSSVSMQQPPPLPTINTQISTLPRPGPIIRHHSKPSTSSLDPAATHYQDPAARLKLRVYLASPQKFDEALEFGFPALQEQNNASARPKTSPVLPGVQARTFFNDDTPSLSADDESVDREERRRQESPCTPETPIFPVQRPSYKSSMDKSAFRPQLVTRYTDTYGQSSNSDREMTLHMTLTRSDLRSPDELKPPRLNVNDAPLEHAPLTVPNNVATIWDELPEEPSKVKRFFKKMTFRN